MRKLAVVILAAALCGSAFAQREGQSRRNLGAQATSPVRVSEVNVTLLKYEKIIRKVLELPGTPAGMPTTDPKPATKAQILNGLNRLFEMAKPEFKMTPRDTKYDSGAFSIAKGTPSRSILEKLVKWGFVGKVSPLAISKTDNLSLAEFGDTMGLFLARIADLTHTPNTKFSPYLQGG